MKVLPNPGPVKIESASAAPVESKKLLEQVRDELRLRHYSLRTEQAYSDWIKRYVKFHGMRKRTDLEDGSAKVTAFLTHLAVERQVAAATQKQALNALVFLYAQVLRVQLGVLGDYGRPKRPARLPVVLSKEEVGRLLARMEGTVQLITRLLYGTGMRLMEGMRLRVKDVATTMIYLHVMQKPGLGVKSPLDAN